MLGIVLNFCILACRNINDNDNVSNKLKQIVGNDISNNNIIIIIIVQ